MARATRSAGVRTRLEMRRLHRRQILVDGRQTGPSNGPAAPALRRRSGPPRRRRAPVRAMAAQVARALR